MELDFEKLVKLTEASTNPQIESNALSVSDVLKQSDNILKNIDKLFELVDKIERSPLISTVARAQFQKAGIEVKPLITENIKYVEVGVKPASETHKAMFEQLNSMSEDQLKENLKKYQEQETENDRVHTENRENKNH